MIELRKTAELEWEENKQCTKCGVWIMKSRGSVIMEGENPYCYLCAKELELPQEVRDIIEDILGEKPLMDIVDEKVDKRLRKNRILNKIMFWR